MTVFGPRTRALLKDATDFVQAVTFQFKPGWSRPVLGVAANEITDRYVVLEDLWGGAGHDLELLAATSESDVLDRVARAIAARLHRMFEPGSARLADGGVYFNPGSKHSGATVLLYVILVPCPL